MTAVEKDSMFPFARRFQVAETYQQQSAAARRSPLLTQYQKTGNFSLGIDVPYLLRRHSGLRKRAYQLAARYPAFEQRMQQRYGADWRQQSVPRQETTLKLASPFGKRAQLSNPDVSVWWGTAQLPIMHSDDLRQQIVQQGVAIRDYRALEKTAEVVAVQEDWQLATPSEPGIYHVYDDGGSKHEALLLPLQPAYGKTNYDDVTGVGRVLVVVTDGSGAYTMTTSELIAATVEDKEPELLLREWQADLPSVEAAEADQTYMLIYEDMVIGPFAVNQKDAVELHVSPKNPPTLSSSESYIDTYPEYYDIIQIVPGASRIRVQKGRVRVPPEAKLLKIKTRKEGESIPCCSGGGRIKAPFVPQTMEQYLGGLDKQARELLPTFCPGNLKLARQQLDAQVNVVLEPLHRERGHVKLNARRVPIGQAKVELVTRYGIGLETAEEMLKQASRMRYIAKLANPSLLPTTATFPDLPEQGATGDMLGVVPYGIEEAQMGTGVTTGTLPAPPFERSDAYRDPSMPMDGIPPGVQEGFGPESPDAMFEMSALQALTQNNRVDGLISQLTSDLLTSMNSLGEFLFVFYAHPDAIADRYGEQDMDSLEDMVISLFENAGDMYAQLLQPEAVSATTDLASLPSTTMESGLS